MKSFGTDEGDDPERDCEEWQCGTLGDASVLFEVTHQAAVRFPDHTGPDLLGAGPMPVSDAALGPEEGFLAGEGEAAAEVYIVEEDGEGFVEEGQGDGVALEEEEAGHGLRGVLGLAVGEGRKGVAPEGGMRSEAIEAGEEADEPEEGGKATDGALNFVIGADEGDGKGTVVGAGAEGGGGAGEGVVGEFGVGVEEEDEISGGAGEGEVIAAREAGVGTGENEGDGGELVGDEFGAAVGGIVIHDDDFVGFFWGVILE